MSLVRTSYDPASTAVVGPDSKRLVQFVDTFEPADRDEDDESEYVLVRLTALGNEALYTLCHTPDQKMVWSFPSYEFVIRKNSVTAAQIKTGRPSYVNALLIASRGIQQKERCGNNTRAVFVDDVRVPGYWGGACAGCKWKDGASGCSYAARGEAKYLPSSFAAAPATALQELLD